MMKNLRFYKLEAAGNDFVLIDCRKEKAVRGLSALSKKFCDRSRSIGADGLLVIVNSKKAAIRMRIFNADGSEAEMCGNGIRCVGAWALDKKLVKKGNIFVETMAGVLLLEVKKDSVKVKMSEPFGFKEDLSVKLKGKTRKAYFINTGVPHTIVFSKNIASEDILSDGRSIRFNKQFQPAGTNANFVQVKSGNRIALRTYERGVEAETFACGTGSTAAAIISSLAGRTKKKKNNKVFVETAGGDVLKIYFSIENDTACDVYMEGPAKLVFAGQILI